MQNYRICYIRFGEIPPLGYSKNWLINKLEEGVSVYEAMERNGIYSVILPSLLGGACVSLSGVLDRPMYEVSGDLIGIGSDGEPLLSNCEIVKEIHQFRDSQGMG